MTVRRVYMIEDPKDKKVLKTPCRPIKLPRPGLQRLADDMFETMHENKGLGLAAPQIGLSIRMLVIDIPSIIETQEDGTEIEVASPARHVLLNPHIVKMSPEEITSFEGCLSLPRWYGTVPRAAWVTVEYYDFNGKPRRLRKIDGLLGRVVQHEIDHLDGILFTERIRDLSTLHEISMEDEIEERSTLEKTVEWPATEIAPRHIVG